MTQLSSASTLYKKQLEREKLSQLLSIGKDPHVGCCLLQPFLMLVYAGIAACLEKDVL